MSTWVIVATTLAVTVTVPAVVLGWVRFRNELGRRVAHEQAIGHVKIRRRMKNLAGKGYFPSVIARVEKPETMRFGHLWIVVSKTKGIPVRERIGWALTKRGAQRRLDHYVKHLDEKRRSQA